MRDKKWHYLNIQNFMNTKVRINRNPKRKAYKKARHKKAHNRMLRRMDKKGWYKTSFLLS